LCAERKRQNPIAELEDRVEELEGERDDLAEDLSKQEAENLELRTQLAAYKKKEAPNAATSEA
jgi:prefoldin subunit 5